ncbi:hypothetical protein [Thermomonas brevis]|uniref:hypothetical protein n=1 Tax=Thermomonas brevis TaxID=215691 RepID=UPI001CB6EC60|nr:hypothetical protein [Thermomonas brevis]
MRGFDIAVVALVSAAALALHVGLFVLIRRWMDRDLALSFAGDDAHRRDYMLRCLRRAKAEDVKRRDLPAWLERAAAECPARAEPQASA